MQLHARLLAASAAAAVVTLLVLSGLTWRADAWFYDALGRHESGAADDRILRVAIDEKSLAELGRWPWPRRTHAQLIDRLTAADVRGVGLDILLSEPALFDPEGDALLARALSRNGKVVLPVYAETQGDGGATVELTPIPEFAASAAALGHVDRPLDPDGVARSAYLRAGLGSARWPALALALSQLSNEGVADDSLPGLRIPPIAASAPERWMRDYRVLLPQSGPRDAASLVSYADVANGTVPAEALRGRWILIGITAAGMGEAAATPEIRADARASRQSALDYQADTLRMLTLGDAVAPLTALAQILLSAALATLPLLLLGLPGMRTPWRPLLIATASTLLLAWLLLRFGRLWFPPAAALSALALGALLWLSQALRQNRLRAQSDPLTGLPNRISFDSGLEQELRQTQRSGQPLSLLLLDVDHFKRLNEESGRAAGDQALRALGELLRARARRPRDLVARLEGDRFAVLLPETTPQAAAAIATTIHVDLANISGRRSGHVRALPFTASIGIHTSRGGDETTGTDFYERADAALQHAKQAGRNRSFSHNNENGFAAA